MIESFYQWKLKVKFANLVDKTYYSWVMAAIAIQDSLLLKWADGLYMSWYIFQVLKKTSTYNPPIRLVIILNISLPWLTPL